MIGTQAPAARLTWRDVFLAVGGVEAVAVALWLLPASVHIVSWTASGIGRVALFAPASRLVAFAGGGLAAAIVALALTHRSGGISPLRSTCAPLLLLWALAVPYLPWLPDRMPLLLVLAGPLRYGVVLTAACWLAANLWTHMGGAVRAARGGWLEPRRRTIFLVSLAIYLAAGLYSAGTLGPGGDEPHYLIITQSLLFDRDLKIENNHQRGDYRPYFRAELRPDYYTRGKNGQIYSIHAPGLPAIVAPAFVAGGYLGTVAFICLLSALAALAVHDAAILLASRRTAFIVWAATCFTVPFVPQSWLIFPEAPAALIVASAVLWVIRDEEAGATQWLLRGVVLALLPWLHTKFVVLLAVFAAALALRAWPSWKRLLAFAAPIAVSSAAWLLFFYVIYGVFDPQAPYGAYVQANVRFENLPRGLLGLFFDQKFGLLFYSPVYLFAIAGAWTMLRGRTLRYAGLVLTAAIAVFMIGTTRLYMWWGGSSAPARFLAPIVPCLAPFVAVAVERFKSLAARSLLGVWLAISLAVAAAGALWPLRLFLYSVPHGQGRLVEALQGPAPVAASIPTFTEQNWHAPFEQLVPWVVAAFAGVALMIWASRRLGSRWQLGAAGASAFIIIGSLLARTPAVEAREETARRGSTELLWAYDPVRLRGFDYTSLGKADPPRVYQLATLVTRRPVSSDAKQPLVAGPFNLPAGAYDARVSFAGAGPASGELLAWWSDRAIFGRTAGTLSNPATVSFELPVAARRVGIAAPDPRVAASVTDVEIRARAIVPAGSRDEVNAREIESIAGAPGAYIVYTDDHVFPEGGVFWTRGTEDTTIVVTPAGRSQVVLTLYLGPMSGDVAIAAGGNTRTVNVQAGRAEQVLLTVPSGARIFPIRIQSPTMFRPSEVDPKSGDTRRLGCQVRVEVQ